MYAKGVNFRIGLANARNDAEHVIRLMVKTEIPFELATTKLDTWDNAESAFLIETNKVIVTRQKSGRL